MKSSRCETGQASSPIRLLCVDPHGSTAKSKVRAEAGRLFAPGQQHGSSLEVWKGPVVTNVIMILLTAIIALFTYLVWKVYERIAWLTGAMERQSM